MSKYKVTWGIHRGTITSRDVGDPKEFDTEEEALAWFEATKEELKAYHHVFWFCNLKSPDGSKRSLEENFYER